MLVGWLDNIDNWKFGTAADCDGPLDLAYCTSFHTSYSIRSNFNKPKGLKVAKEDQRSIGSMVNRLDG